MVKRRIQQAGVKKEGACHLFRHTPATLMMDNGADIRFIQAMLGHADISTTQIYTHVAIAQLKEVYLRTNPGNRAHDDQEHSGPEMLECEANRDEI